MASTTNPEDGLLVQAYTVAHEYPTPREADLGWRCAGHADPEMFHPTTPEALTEAVEFCAPCPMKETCAALGLARRETGVWGGMLLESGKVRPAPGRAGRPRKVAA